MKQNQKVISVFLIVLPFLFTCGQNSNRNTFKVTNSISENTPQSIDSVPETQTLTIESFLTFPPEVEGCSCYFSGDSTAFAAGEYIFANDFAQIAFMKINGSLIKFTAIDFTEIDSTTSIGSYKSPDYEMSVESKDGIQSGDEAWLKTGTIKLKDKKGHSVTKSFFGECGC